MTILSSPSLKYLAGGLKIAVFLSLFFIASAAQAANPLDVVINEIAWMGTVNLANDEWIELYNNAESPISLDGWILKSADEKLKINLKGTIPARGFYLLERTDDTTVPKVVADLIYKGALRNNGEDLKLYDNLNNLIDEVDCSTKWLAGDNTTKQTMEKTSTKWQTSKDMGGTPNAQNSTGAVAKTEPTPTEEAIKASTEEKPAEAPLPLTYPERVIFNEILPSPKGTDDLEEWIEVFNQNNFEVDLSGWQIADTAGKIYTLPVETKISAQGFLVLPRPTTKITLNNDEDGLLFLQPNGNILDSVKYQKAPQGQSYNRTEGGWVWSSTLTPGSTNIIPASSSKIKDEEKNKEEPQKELATVSESFRQIQEKQISKPLFTFLVALGLAVSSGVIILIFKKRLKSAKIER